MRDGANQREPLTLGAEATESFEDSMGFETNLQGCAFTTTNLFLKRYRDEPKLSSAKALMLAMECIGHEPKKPFPLTTDAAECIVEEAAKRPLTEGTQAAESTASKSSTTLARQHAFRHITGKKMTLTECVLTEVGCGTRWSVEEVVRSRALSPAGQAV